MKPTVPCPGRYSPRGWAGCWCHGLEGSGIGRALLSLLGEVRLLITRDVLDRGVVGELSGLTGYKNLYRDLVQLVAVFRENAEAVDGGAQ